MYTRRTEALSPKLENRPPIPATNSYSSNPRVTSLPALAKARIGATPLTPGPPEPGAPIPAPRHPPRPQGIPAGQGSAGMGALLNEKQAKEGQCNFTEEDKSLPLASRWSLGSQAVTVSPHPNLAGAATSPGLPCVGGQSGPAGLARQERGLRGRRGSGRPYSRRAGSTPKLQCAARPALLPPAPPASPALPRLPQRPTPPPPTPSRSLIDGSLKKSLRSRAASAGELQHSRNPGADGSAQRPRAHGRSTPCATHPPGPRALAREGPGDPDGRKQARTLLPSPK